MRLPAWVDVCSNWIAQPPLGAREDEMAGLRARINGCFSKKRYSTRGLAEIVARRIEAETAVTLRVYYCGFCYGFHLTKRLRATAMCCSRFSL